MTVSTGFKCRSSLTTCAAWAGASPFAFRLPQAGLIKRMADPVGRFAAHSDKMSTSSTSSSKLKSKKFDNCGEVIERMEDLVADKAIRAWPAPRTAGVDFQMTLPLNSMTPRPFCLPRWSFLMAAAGRRFGVLQMTGERWWLGKRQLPLQEGKGRLGDAEADGDLTCKNLSLARGPFRNANANGRFGSLENHDNLMSPTCGTCPMRGFCAPTVGFGRVSPSAALEGEYPSDLCLVFAEAVAHELAQYFPEHCGVRSLMLNSLICRNLKPQRACKARRLLAMPLSRFSNSWIRCRMAKSKTTCVCYSIMCVT